MEYELTCPIFGLNAPGFRSRHCLMAFCLCFSLSRLFMQLLQLQLWQNSPLAKHSQYLEKLTTKSSNIILRAKKCRKFRQIGISYSFRQCDFVQLHGFLCLTPDDSYFSSGGSCLMFGLTSSGSSSGGNISSSRLARLAPPLKLFCFGVTTRLIAWF